MDIYDSRRTYLERLIAGPRFEGSQAKFAKETGISPSYVTRMLKKAGEAGSKRIGEDMARSIEDRLRLQTGSLVSPVFDRGQVVVPPAPKGNEPQAVGVRSEVGRGLAELADSVRQLARASMPQPNAVVLREGEVIVDELRLQAALGRALRSILKREPTLDDDGRLRQAIKSATRPVEADGQEKAEAPAPAGRRRG